MKRPLVWIATIIFILGNVGNATAGNLNALISKNYLVSVDAAGTYHKGVQQAQEGNYKRAQQLFEQAVRQDPKHVGALSYLSVVYANTRQYSSAIKTAQKALKLDSANEEANQTLVRIYETRSSWKQMITPLNALTQNYGSNSRYFAKLGEAHYRLKHYADAVDPLQQAVNLNSTDYLSAYRLGEMQARMGNYESAVGYLEQSLSSAPSRTVKYYNMGLVYGYLKRYDDAIRYFELALNEKPGLSEAYYNIGAMYQNSEQLESAMENYEKALKIDSNLEMASSNLEYLKGYLERQKQQKTAGEMTFEQTSPETTQETFEPAVEETPAIEEAPVEEMPSFDSSDNSFETTPPAEEPFGAIQEEAPTESFDAAQEETPAVEQPFGTVEEAPAQESFETAGESGVESSSGGSESPAVTPVGTSEENPEVTPIGTSEDSFEASTGDESGSATSEAAVEEPATEETPAGFEDAVDANDFSFRNF